MNYLESPRSHFMNNMSCITRPTCNAHSRHFKFSHMLCHLFFISGCLNLSIKENRTSNFNIMMEETAMHILKHTCFLFQVVKGQTTAKILLCTMDQKFLWGGNMPATVRSHPSRWPFFLDCCLNKLKKWAVGYPEAMANHFWKQVLVRCGHKTWDCTT